MSGDLGLGSDKWLEGCSGQVRRQLHHSRALPGCLIGVVIFQGRLKKWSAEKRAYNILCTYVGARYVVLGRPNGRFYWQNVGEALPCLVPGHNSPTIHGVSARERTRRSREATRGLQELARRRAVEAEAARSRRRAARARMGPGSRCPRWLATLMGDGDP